MMRFLIARSMDVEKAAKMFVQWQKWRDTMVPNGRIDESEIEDELGTKKMFLQGLSKNGHAVLFLKGSKHFPAKDQVQFKSESPYLVPFNSISLEWEFCFEFVSPPLELVFLILFLRSL